MAAAPSSTRMSTLFPALKAKRLSWADRTDEIETVCQICELDTISLEQFVRVIHSLLPKCEMDPNTTAHHFQINDIYYDLMYRQHVVLSISSRREDESAAKSTDPVTTDDEETTEQSAGSQEDDTERDTAAAAAETVTESVAAAVAPTAAEQEEDDGGQWTQVKSRRSKQVQRAETLLQGQETFYVFANEANANFMDFIGVVQGFDCVLAEAKQRRWAHAYQLDSNTVYDFHDEARPGHFRSFMPNTAYVHRFSEWFQVYTDHGNAMPVDDRKFFVFRENSTWPTWTLLGQYQGLSNVRRAVLDGGAKYGHAYCRQTNDLVNFWLDDGHFRQRLSKAPAKYLERFENTFDDGGQQK